MVNRNTILWHYICRRKIYLVFMGLFYRKPRFCRKSVKHGLGYDSCPMDGFDFNAVARLIHLPDHYAIGFMVAIGKATGESWPRERLPIDSLVVQDHF